MISPGAILIEQEKEGVCKDLIPIIPVKMVEAWMLSDLDALQRILKTTINVRDSALPGKAKQVERVDDPKEVLKRVVQGVYPGQSRHWNRIMGELYAKLAFEISLTQLSQVPSYKQFVEDFTITLRNLKMIE